MGDVDIDRSRIRSENLDTLTIEPGATALLLLDLQRELDNRAFSAFHGTALDVLLRSLDIDTVVLTGVVTHGGVETTARDALIRDFSVVILDDCVAAFDEDLHLASLRRMGLYQTVMDSSAYLRELKRPRSQ